MNPLEIIARFYSPDREAYHILVEHSLDVAALADEVMRAHPDLGADPVFVREAAMLHDLGIYLTHAPGIDCHGTEPYMRHGYLGAELLRGLGLPQHARVAERHTGSGLTPEAIRERGIDLPPGIYMPESPEELIICYADKFYSKTKLGQRKSLEAVRKSLGKHGAEAVQRFDRMHQVLALPSV